MLVVLCLSFLTNIGTILYLVTTESYIKFRGWIYKKCGAELQQKKSKRKKKKLKRQISLIDDGLTSRPLIIPIEQNHKILKTRKNRRFQNKHKSQNYILKSLEDQKKTEYQNSSNGIKSKTRRRVRTKFSVQVSYTQ